MVSGAGGGPASLPLPLIYACSLLEGGHVLRGGVHTAGPGLEHLRFRHCTLGHHHDLYCDRWLTARGWRCGAGNLGLVIELAWR